MTVAPAAVRTVAVSARARTGTEPRRPARPPRAPRAPRPPRPTIARVVAALRPGTASGAAAPILPLIWEGAAKAFGHVPANAGAPGPILPVSAGPAVTKPAAPLGAAAVRLSPGALAGPTLGPVSVVAIRAIIEPGSRSATAIGVTAIRRPARTLPTRSALITASGFLSSVAARAAAGAAITAIPRATVSR